MKAVILAAGKGTRLPKITRVIPKPMAEIQGKPLLLWQIEYLKKYGIRDIFINLHYLPEKITDYFGNGEKFDVSITYSLEKELLGTGGALLAFVKKLDEETFILFGDVLTNVDLEKMLKFHLEHNGIITATVHPSKHPKDSDLVEFSSNRLKKILAKPHLSIPKSPYSLAALYIFSKEAFRMLPQKVPYDIAHDLIPFFLKQKLAISCYNTFELMLDIGTPERLKKAQKILL